MPPFGLFRAFALDVSGTVSTPSSDIVLVLVPGGARSLTQYGRVQTRRVQHIRVLRFVGSTSALLLPLFGGAGLVE